MKFLLPALILLILLVVVFRSKPKITVPANVRAGDLILRPCDYKTKTQTYRAECGTLIVPESRLSPRSRLIALPIKRIHARSDSTHKPIIYLGGGPGMSNMRFDPPDDLLADQDVLIVGYRGVDGSSMLNCPEFSKAALGDGKDVFSDESLAMMTEAIRACSARFKASGVDLSAYTMPAVVEDVEAARVALGYERINLLSESYGTRVAQICRASSRKPEPLGEGNLRRNLQNHDSPIGEGRSVDFGRNLYPYYRCVPPVRSDCGCVLKWRIAPDFYDLAFVRSIAHTLRQICVCQDWEQFQ